MLNMLDTKWCTDIQINKHLYAKYNVRRIIRDNVLISKEMKMDWFLKGAIFETCTINGFDYDLIIYDSVLRILHRE